LCEILIPVEDDERLGEICVKKFFLPDVHAVKINYYPAGSWEGLILMQHNLLVARSIGEMQE
jgi:hypothetical protein